MNTNMELTANFQPITYTLTVNVNDETLGVVSRDPNMTSYPPGTVVTLTAAAAAVGSFYRWLYDGEVITNATITVIMDSNKTLTAEFAPVVSVTTVNINGKTYRIMKMGSQTWMAENLNIETSNSWCHSDNPANCAKYGRLYNWVAAKTACPAGWHLPANEEWNRLVATAGGSTKLKAESPDWDGTDEYGFSALPGGSKSPSYINLGRCGNWWTATERDSDRARDRHMCADSMNVMEFDYAKSNGFSVRCVQN
jgi:uncharacterized protein (TIGR02145 family)